MVSKLAALPRRWLLFCGLLLYLLAVWFDWLPWLRGWGNIYEGGWVWPLHHAPTGRILVVIAIMGGVWATVLLAERLQRVPRVAATSAGKRAVKASYLLLMIALGYCLQMAMLGLKADNPNGLLVERVNNRDFTSYFTYAELHPDLSDYFSGYPATLNNSSVHIQDHPPGPALFYWLNLRVASSLPPDWRHDLATLTRQSLGNGPDVDALNSTLTDVQMLAALMGGTLVLLLASATVLPLFGLARLLGPPGYEFRLAGLGLALPGLMLMAPMFDQVCAFICATALYLAVRALAAGNVAACSLWAIAAGLALAVGLFISWAVIYIVVIVAALGLVCIVGSRRLLLGRQSNGRMTRQHKLTWLVGVAAGIAIPLALLAIATHLDFVSTFQFNMNKLQAGDAMRPYWPWVLYSPIDFLQFLGLPLALVTATSVVLARGEGRGVWGEFLTPDSSPLTPHPSPLNVYACVFWLLVIGHDLSGTSRGEQGRTLIFLMPLALAAVYWWSGNVHPSRGLVAALFFAQAAVCVVIGARWFVP